MKIAKLLAAVCVFFVAEAFAADDWVSAWAMSHNARGTTPAMAGRTVRMILTPSVAGDALRVKIENTMGEAPVAFTGATLARAAESAGLDAKSIVRLTFAGKPGLTLAPGAGAYSDAVEFKVKARERIALSLEVESASDISMHHVGLRTNWSAAGARAGDPASAGFEPLPEVPPANSGQWPYYWVAALDVRAKDAGGAIVLFGDSITDGRCSTRDAGGTVRADIDQRWGDVFAARLAAKGNKKAVAITSISGNRIIDRGNGPSALERLDRDVLDRAGVTHVVLFEGTNDLAGDFTAEQVIAGIEEIVKRVRARGLKIIGATVIPRGRPAPTPGWSKEKEAQRKGLNAWMRTRAPLDGVIDFDALMKSGPVVTMADGSDAPSIPSEWNCDHTHPNAAGYKAMGEFVDLKLFERK